MRRERRLPTPLRPRRPGSGSGPTARRRAIRASEPALGDDFDPVSHNTAVLLAQCADVDSALNLEWVISRFLPCWGNDPEGFDMDYVESMLHLIIDELAMTTEVPALLALRGLEAVASGAIAEQASAAAELVAAAGITAPPWAWQIGQAKAVDACVALNAEDASAGVIVEYAYPDGERHALAAFIADELGGAVKFMGLMQPFDRACADDGELPLERIAPAEAERLLREALEATDQLHAHFEGDPSMRDLGALAWSRVRD
jgi:hypothetical protein